MRDMQPITLKTTLRAPNKLIGVIYGVKTNKTPTLRRPIGVIIGHKIFDKWFSIRVVLPVICYYFQSGLLLSKAGPA